MEPSIQTLSEKKLVGKHMTMSFANNKTAALWQNFMQGRKAIANTVSSHLYSLQLYSPGFFHNFTLDKLFEKWAALEVAEFEPLPAGMEAFVLESGLYAVFFYKGAAQDTAQTFQYILEEWLPTSIYALDNRPHFELLGNQYKKDHPDSEEEIWIPIRLKR